jgi:hypothetical protein
MKYQNFIKAIQKNYPTLSNEQIDSALLAVKKISKPDDIDLKDYYNYLAIHFLEELDYEFPSQKEIDDVEEPLKILYTDTDESWDEKVEAHT